MSDPDRPAEGAAPAAGTPDADTAAARRRRRARVFGETLPESSGDERPAAWGDHEGAGEDEERIRREVPPHHG